MAVLKNRAKMSTSTTGTGSPITLGSAEDGYQTFADAGVANADVVRYVIEDGSNWEIGTGTYTATGTTLSRTVSESSNSDAAINLSGSATVFIGATAEDIPALYAANDVSATAPTASGDNSVAIGNDAQATSTNSIAIGSTYNGNGARATTGAGAVAIGGARATAAGAFAAMIGSNSSAGAQGTDSIAIGFGANATNTSSSAIGANTTSVGYGSLAIGREAYSTADRSVAITNSYASGSAAFAAAITNNTASYGATGANSIAIGQLAKATQANSIAIGDTATSTTANLIALGGTTDTVQISGTYTLPTSDGTNGQVLTTDGSGAVTFADAGGGGADLYAANESSPTSQPNAVGANAIAIGEGATANGDESFAFGDQSVAGTTGGNNFALAMGFRATASGAFSACFSPYNGDATAQHSAAFGSYAQAVGTGSVSLGKSYASGTDSFAAAIANNSASYGATATSSIAIGNQAKATSSNAIAIGNAAVSSGGYSIAMGISSQAIASKAISIGDTCSATKNNAVAIGHDAESIIKGKFAYSAGQFDSTGDAQTGIFVLRSDTTDATAEPMTTDKSSGSTDDQIVLPNNSAYSFSGTIIARESATNGSDYASWEIKGALLRDANAASTVLGNGIQNKLYATSGASAWAIALTADTTNGGLKIEVTGAASTNIRWVATVNTSEVTYA